MKWQKARILRSSWPNATGREIWVKCGPPIEREATVMRTGNYSPPQRRFEVAITPEDPMSIPTLLASNVELLARSEADFTDDDVPMVSWYEFIALADGV